MIQPPLSSLVLLAFLGTAGMPAPSTVPAGAESMVHSSSESGDSGTLRIRWLPWERRSFQLAAALKRPVILYLRAEDCRLCMSQERDLLAGKEVVQWIRDEAVPVAVDVDLRPAVAARYVTGLIPTLVFLLPNGEPIYDVENLSSLHRIGGFFADREEFNRYLQQTASYFHVHTLELVRKAAEVARMEAKVRSYPPGEPPLDRFPELVNAIRTGFDFKYGGFGRRFKSIQEAPYLLFRSLDDKVLDRAILATAEHLLGGGLHDAVEGGFHHYATRRDWSAPALEKRLGVNASAIRFLVVGATLDRSRADLREGVEETAAFLLEHLVLPGGGFALSQHGSLGPDDPGSYFTSSKAERSRLRPPPLNTRVVASSNAMAAVALMEAGALLERADLEEAGLAAVDFLAAHLYGRGRGLSHFLDDAGKARRPGLLLDQVAGLEAFISAYQVRGSDRDLDIARDLFDFCIANLRPKETYFIDRVSDRRAVGLMRRPLVPLEANGRMALLAFRLAGLTGEEKYRAAGLTTLGSLAPAVPRMGPREASYARALQAARQGPVVEVVVGAGEKPHGQGETMARSLRRAAFLLPVAGVVTHILGNEEASMEAARLKLWAETGRAGALVCHGQKCLGPFTQAHELLPAARTLLDHTEEKGKAMASD